MESNPITPNPSKLLNDLVKNGKISWVSENTALLVIHGIGNQFPLETVDQLGRGLIAQYQKEFSDELSISHHIVSKKDANGDSWFDNVLRISKKNSDYYIDIYEYYWANYTEDQAGWKDINTWLQGVVKGAITFYDDNAALGKQYKDKSPFFNSDNGEFKGWRYRLFISAASKMVLALDFTCRVLLRFISRIPFFGSIADSLLHGYMDSMMRGLTNVIGDVAVYNVVDPKSKFYDIRRRVLDGAVKALKFLIEKKTVGDSLEYTSVIVAGHSLGSQVAYDAINKFNLLLNEGEIAGYDREGCFEGTDMTICDQLKGFITFGSPLDKIIFFLRENVPSEQYIRKQFLSHFHGFKLRDIDFVNSNTSNKNHVKANSGLKRHLENIPWRNYYDGHDYVSGGLDYYSGLINIDCQFKSGRFGFTHSYYWECENFYKDIILSFLSKQKKEILEKNDALITA